MRFSLRTLTVVMLLGGPALAGLVWISGDAQRARAAILLLLLILGLIAAIAFFLLAAAACGWIVELLFSVVQRIAESLTRDRD